MRHNPAGVADSASRREVYQNSGVDEPSDLQSRWQEVWEAARRADARGAEAGPARTPAGSGRACTAAPGGAALRGGVPPGSPRRSRSRWRPPRPAGGCSVLAADGGRLTPAHGAAARPLNLVVITLDTTRADHVGAYGSRDVETPALDRLARDGVLFEQAMTTAPLTLPAHASIFTGRFPPEHGVRDNGGFFLGARPDDARRDPRPRRVQDRRVRGGLRARQQVGNRPGIRHLRRRLRHEQVAGAVARRDPASGQRSRRQGASRGSTPSRTGRSSPGCISTIPTRRTRRPSRTARSTRDIRTGARWRSPTRRSAASSSSSSRAACSSTPSSRFSATTARAWAITARMRTASSSTRPRRGCRSSSARRSNRPGAGAWPTRCGSSTWCRPCSTCWRLPAAQAVAGRSLVPLMTGATIELGLEGYAEAMYPLHHYGWSDLRAMRSGRFKVIDAPRPELYDLETDPGEKTDIYQQRRTVGDQMIARLRAMEQAFEKVLGGAAAVRRRSRRCGRGSPRSATSGRSSPPPTTRAPTQGRPEGQVPPLQPARRGARPGADEGVVPEGHRHPPQGAGGRPPGHRRVVLARQRVLQGTAAPGGHRATSSAPWR